LLAGVCAALLWYRAYPDIGAWTAPAVFLLKGFYVAWLASHAVQFLRAAQFGGGSAERKMKRFLKQRNAALVPARSRRFFFF